jgi:hypothetical protein
MQQSHTTELTTGQQCINAYAELAQASAPVESYETILDRYIDREDITDGELHFVDTSVLKSIGREMLARHFAAEAQTERHAQASEAITKLMTDNAGRQVHVRQLNPDVLSPITELASTAAAHNDWKDQGWQEKRVVGKASGRLLPIWQEAKLCGVLYLETEQRRLLTRQVRYSVIMNNPERPVELIFE